MRQTAHTGMDELGIGVVGCGTISQVYLRNIARSEGLRTVACSDLLPERARDAAERFGVPTACTIEELLADPRVDIVLNLTIPAAHAEITLAALEAGKHVYSEKPLAITPELGRRILDTTAERGLRLGVAPDTFLGAGIQKVIELVDGGAIGVPVAGSAFMLSRGPESWHHFPEFFYQTGGGPLLDMGPYYLNTLISVLGPVARVSAAARASYSERVVGRGPNAGRRIPVELDTHVAGLLEFRAGPIVTMVTSFDVSATRRGIEIYGSEGTVTLHDPNNFRGPVRHWRQDVGDWVDVPIEGETTDDLRGLGVAEMAAALRTGRPHRASAELAFHGLEVMFALADSAQSGRRVDIASTCARPEPVTRSGE